MNRTELPHDRGRPPTRAEVAAYGEQLSAYVAFLRERYGTLYDDLCRLLDQHDPIGIARPE